MKRLAYLDVILAKVKQIEDLNLIRPVLSNKTDIVGMFNPKIKNILNSKGKKYQKIDITLDDKVIIITGVSCFLTPLRF